jgi:hypothetical protein
MWWIRGIFVVGVLGGLAILGAGIFRLVQDETGTRAVATVSDCSGVDTQYSHETCTGSWVIGGSLLAGGHVEVGDISGAHDKDIGKKLNVTVRNGTAYTRGLLLPILLIGLGIVIAGSVGLLGKVTWSTSPSKPKAGTATA